MLSLVQRYGCADTHFSREPQRFCVATEWQSIYMELEESFRTPLVHRIIMMAHALRGGRSETIRIL